ncbi:hypothetical protein P2A14_13230, partial [Xanthomonas perforans]
MARGAGMSTRDPGGDDLNTLAAAAGVMVDWVDASDQPRQVSEQSVHAVLSALELPAATAAQCGDTPRRGGCRRLRRGAPLSPMPTVLVRPGSRGASVVL